jgi:hypothetical protein
MRAPPFPLVRASVFASVRASVPAVFARGIEVDWALLGPRREQKHELQMMRKMLMLMLMPMLLPMMLQEVPILLRILNLNIESRMQTRRTSSTRRRLTEPD